MKITNCVSEFVRSEILFLSLKSQIPESIKHMWINNVQLGLPGFEKSAIRDTSEILIL